MKFNEDKCKVMFLGRRVNNVFNNPYYHVDDSTLVDPLNRQKILTLRNLQGTHVNLIETSMERD